MQIVKPSRKNLNEIIEFLNNNGVVICPTDTVYGFLADAGNKKAIEKIYKIKKRPKSKPLAVFVKDLKMAKELVEISEAQEKIIKKYWPGKYTFILKFEIRNPKSETNSKFKILNSKLLTKNGKIALRIPKYNFLNKLLKKINKPLAQTSVNISGEPPMTKISDIIEQFGKSDILIIDAGNLKKSNPSKIIDLTNENIKILRK